MHEPRALQLRDLDPDLATLAQLDAELSAREAELTALQVELQDLQSRYLTEVGVLYGQLAELEAALVAAEIRAGLRPPPSEDDADDADEDDAAGADVDAASCSNRGVPTDDLKRMFRDVAKAIHPDRAVDDATRFKRHSLMAEANRAYAERDGDRLRLILHRWERSAEAVEGDSLEAEQTRLHRRQADVRERLALVEAELEGLRQSAIFRLRTKILDARTQGWDLFAEILRHVKRELQKATARLAYVQRTYPDGAWKAAD